MADVKSVNPIVGLVSLWNLGSHTVCAWVWTLFEIKMSREPRVSNDVKQIFLNWHDRNRTTLIHNLMAKATKDKRSLR